MWSFETETRKAFRKALKRAFKGASRTRISQCFRGILIICGFVLPLGTCGFEPAFAPGGSLALLRDRVQVGDPDNRTEFVLKGELEKRLGQGSDFELNYDIITTLSDVGITADQVITRRQIDGAVDIVLTDRATGAVLLSATLTAFTSYGTTGTTASTAFAQEAAYDRLMVILADRIASRLATLQKVPA